MPGRRRGACPDGRVDRPHRSAGPGRQGLPGPGRPPRRAAGVLPDRLSAGRIAAGLGRKAALAPDGAEYDALGRIAQDNATFLSGNAYETDKAFPGLYFQASFVIDPSGAIVLRYRRLVSMFAPTPHDVWDRYLDLYGLDGVFPVADTSIGRLGAIASEEILYPEIARALALRGAEVLLHSTSEVGSPALTPKDIAKRARAIENLAYVVSANSAGFIDSDLPANSTDGMSKIVDFLGEVRAAGRLRRELGRLRGDRPRRTAPLPAPPRHGQPAVPPASRAVRARSMPAVRCTRPTRCSAPDGSVTVPERSHFLETQRKVIERLAALGLV